MRPLATSTPRKRVSSEGMSVRAKTVAPEIATVTIQTTKSRRRFLVRWSVISRERYTVAAG